MNSEAGFCIASGRSVPEDPRGARHWGASSCYRLHMRTGRSRLRRYDLTGDADRKRYCRIGERSPDVEHCLTTRAFVASLVLRPSCSSSFSFISKLTDVGPVQLWSPRQSGYHHNPSFLGHRAREGGSILYDGILQPLSVTVRPPGSNGADQASWNSR